MPFDDLIKDIIDGGSSAADKTFRRITSLYATYPVGVVVYASQIAPPNRDDLKTYPVAGSGTRGADNWGFSAGSRVLLIDDLVVTGRASSGGAVRAGVYQVTPTGWVVPKDADDALEFVDGDIVVVTPGRGDDVNPGAQYQRRTLGAKYPNGESVIEYSLVTSKSLVRTPREFELANLDKSLTSTGVAYSTGNDVAVLSFTDGLTDAPGYTTSTGRYRQAFSRAIQLAFSGAANPTEQLPAAGVWIRSKGPTITDGYGLDTTTKFPNNKTPVNEFGTWRKLLTTSDGIPHFGRYAATGNAVGNSFSIRNLNGYVEPGWVSIPGVVLTELRAGSPAVRSKFVADGWPALSDNEPITKDAYLRVYVAPYGNSYTDQFSGYLVEQEYRCVDGTVYKRTGRASATRVDPTTTKTLPTVDYGRVGPISVENGGYVTWGEWSQFGAGKSTVDWSDLRNTPTSLVGYGVDERPYARYTTELKATPRAVGNNTINVFNLAEWVSKYTATTLPVSSDTTRGAFGDGSLTLVSLGTPTATAGVTLLVDSKTGRLAASNDTGWTEYADDSRSWRDRGAFDITKGSGDWATEVESGRLLNGVYYVDYPVDTTSIYPMPTQPGRKFRLEVSTGGSGVPLLHLAVSQALPAEANGTEKLSTKDWSGWVDRSVAPAVLRGWRADASNPAALTPAAALASVTATTTVDLNALTYTRAGTYTFERRLDTASATGECQFINAPVPDNSVNYGSSKGLTGFMVTYELEAADKAGSVLASGENLAKQVFVEDGDIRGNWIRTLAVKRDYSSMRVLKPWQSLEAPNGKRVIGVIPANGTLPTPLGVGVYLIPDKPADGSAIQSQLARSLVLDAGAPGWVEVERVTDSVAPTGQAQPTYNHLLRYVQTAEPSTTPVVRHGRNTWGCLVGPGALPTNSGWSRSTVQEYERKHVYTIDLTAFDHRWMWPIAFSPGNAPGRNTIRIFRGFFADNSGDYPGLGLPTHRPDLEFYFETSPSGWLGGGAPSCVLNFYSANYGLGLSNHCYRAEGWSAETGGSRVTHPYLSSVHLRGRLTYTVVSDYPLKELHVPNSKSNAVQLTVSVWLRRLELTTLDHQGGKYYADGPEIRYCTPKLPDGVKRNLNITSPGTFVWSAPPAAGDWECDGITTWEVT